MNDHIINLQQSKEESLLEAEHEKEEVVATLVHEKGLVNEKLNNSTKLLTNLSADFEKLKRESGIRQEKDKV